MRLRTAQSWDTIGQTVWADIMLPIRYIKWKKVCAYFGLGSLESRASNRDLGAGGLFEKEPHKKSLRGWRQWDRKCKNDKQSPHPPRQTKKPPPKLYYWVAAIGKISLNLDLWNTQNACLTELSICWQEGRLGYLLTIPILYSLGCSGI